MEVIRQIEQLQQKLERIGEKSVGLIQTKGTLHQGHASLIRAARKENKILVVACLLLERERVNKESDTLDFRDQEESRALASLAGADFFFCPSSECIYKEESMTSIQIKNPLVTQLNGNYIDYANKLTTTAIMLNIIKPQRLYMSDKDLQMIQFTKALLKDFHYNCDLRVLPACRDENEMMISTKNKYLKEDEKNQVVNLYKLLQKAQRAYQKGMISSRRIKWHIENELTNLYLCKLEFVEIVEPERLTSIETITDEAIIILTVRVGKLVISDYIILKRDR